MPCNLNNKCNSSSNTNTDNTSSNATQSNLIVTNINNNWKKNCDYGFVGENCNIG